VTAGAGIALLVITDGRDDFLAHTLASANRHLTGPFVERWMFDDTGDADYRATLAHRFPWFQHVNAGRRQGFGGAIRAAWQRLALTSEAAWVFHLEQDFTFNQPVDLAELVAVMQDHPHLAQMALRRQPWNAEEVAAGGVVELHPEAFEEHRDERGRRWLEHRQFFTTNPCLYRIGLCRRGWPEGERSEGVFTRQLLDSGVSDIYPDGRRFGYWGARDSGTWVEHIGQTRVGHGY
jgi:hypothetical protein